MTESPRRGPNQGPNQGPDNGGRSFRIGDAEREDAVHRLGEHFAAGRLSEEEHSQRADQAYAARTQEDLDAVFTDLPGERPAGGEQPWGQWVPPWAQAATGRPGAGGPPYGRGWLPGPLRWLPLPFLIIAGIGTLCAIAHGFFPFFVVPLLAIAAVLFVVTKRYGGAGAASHQR